MTRDCVAAFNEILMSNVAATSLINEDMNVQLDLQTVSAVTEHFMDHELKDRRPYVVAFGPLGIGNTFYYSAVHTCILLFTLMYIRFFCISIICRENCFLSSVTEHSSFYPASYISSFASRPVKD